MRRIALIGGLLLLAACAPEPEECDPNLPWMAPLITSADQLERLRCVREYEGSLQVEVRAIEDLSALSNLEHLGGSLELRYAAVENLDALANLRSADWVTISNNLELRDIRGLGSLERVRLLGVHGNPKLESFESLRGDVEDLMEVSLGSSDVVTNVDSLADITSWGDTEWPVNLVLGGLPELTSLDGVETLLEDGGSSRLHLYLSNLPKLDSLEPLRAASETGYRRLTLQDLPSIDSLEPIAGAPVSYTLRVRRLDQLERLDGLEGVREVEFLNVSENGNLVSIEALSNLESANRVLLGWCHPGDTELIGNTKLESLAGLESLREVRGDISVSGNPELSDISALSSVELLPKLTVRDNPSLDPELIEAVEAETVDACGNAGEEPCGCGG